jgi:hypothetical protein
VVQAKVSTEKFRAKNKEKRLPEDLQSNILQTDSTIPRRKDSHSSKSVFSLLDPTLYLQDQTLVSRDHGTY